MESEITLFRIVDGKPIIKWEAIRQVEADHARTRKFFDANHARFLKQYPDQWVAVFREQVVAVSPDMKDLFRQVDAKGIHRGGVIGGFMDTNPQPRIVSVLR